MLCIYANFEALAQIIGGSASMNSIFRFYLETRRLRLIVFIYYSWGLKTRFLEETGFLGLMVAKIPRFR